MLRNGNAKALFIFKMFSLTKNIIDFTTSRLDGPLLLNDFLTYPISCWSFNQFLELSWIQGGTLQAKFPLRAYSKSYLLERTPLRVISNPVLFSRRPFLVLLFPFFCPGCLLNSLQKYTDSHFAIRQVRTKWFLLWQLLQRCPVFPSAEAAFLILAQVSSRYFLLALASLFLNSNSCLFSSMHLSVGLSNWRLLVERETWLVFGTRYSSASWFEPKV